ncbi:acid-thiol ligase [Dorcoceras hygrometricum]|uniref:Acid-thiol ligase n=1 Tax=Dorcoceras hygrometricum TaxID=472368 RepID=A0A2Z7A6B3_9LAMI|nr:acid-thiol ligase [Dorcoceras hygrometricum]
MGLRNIPHSGLRDVTTWPRPLKGVPDELSDFGERPVLPPSKRPNERYSLFSDLSCFSAEFLRLGLRKRVFSIFGNIWKFYNFLYRTPISVPSTFCNPYGLSMFRKIEKMKAKKQKAKENHVVCHQKFQARIQEAEDSMQAQHLIIEALVEEKDGLLQTIQGLQEANNAPAPFDDEWEEEPEEQPEEEEIEDIPLDEGEIDDE